nr:hypothetical protein L203_03611 [Cryptococcus depauperatus CBS 7841]
MSQSSPPTHRSPNLDSSDPMPRSASRNRLSKLMVPGRHRSGSAGSQISIDTENGGTSSGRATPEMGSRAGKAATTSHLVNDPKFKKYRSQVDKSLQSFENVNEWADFISFLSRLLKTLQSQSPSYSEIPRKLTVAKRLAQCLNPALPSGVHQRALDVYSHIFSIIGMNGLRRDLTIWSSGLFPFFQYAATSVRPFLINIYETYYLPLGDQLRPATKALILALLPGIEEESGDFFDKILFLLDRLSDTLTPSFFLQNMFLILITSSASRLSALNYLTRRMLKPPDHPDAFVEVGLLIRGLSASLDDGNVLVRRTGLDLLLRVLALESAVFREAEETDKVLLVRSAANVVLQKELSLSRRIYTWFLGPGETSQEQMDYFTTHGLNLLSTSLLKDMKTLIPKKGREEEFEAQNPFRVFLALLDRGEVGAVLSPKIIIPALEIVMEASLLGFSEVVNTAAALYDAVDPVVIWTNFHKLIEESNHNKKQDINLIIWILDNIPQHDDEVKQIHIPVLLDTALKIVEGSSDEEWSSEILRLAVSLLKHIPSSVFSRSSSKITIQASDPPLNNVLYNSSHHTSNLNIRIENEVLPRIVSSSFKVCGKAFSGDTPVLLKAVYIVSQLIEYEVPALAGVDSDKWLGALVESLAKFKTFVAVESLVIAVLKASRCEIFNFNKSVFSGDAVSVILDSLFRYLRPSTSLYHARAVQLLWECNRVAEAHTLQDVIARRMTSNTFDKTAVDAFGIFWRLTDDSVLPGEVFRVPICLILESLGSLNPDIQNQAETWLRLNLRSYFRILDPMLYRLMTPFISYDGTYGSFDGRVDLNMIKYEIECIAALFRFSGQGLSKACTTETIKKSVNSGFIGRVKEKYPMAEHYLELIVRILISFVEVKAAPRMGSKSSPLLVLVQAAALSLLQTIVSMGDVSLSLLRILKTSLVNKLLLAIRSHNHALQSKMLHLLHSAINASSHQVPSLGQVTRTHIKVNSSISENIISELVESEFEQRLVAVIIQGISTPSNLSVLQHWIDFVLMTVPLLSELPALLRILTECLSQETRTLMHDMRDGYDKAFLSPARHSTEITDEELGITEVEVIMVLNALEKVLAILSNQAAGRVDDLTPNTGESSKIFGLVSNVFTVEAPGIDSRGESSDYLDNAIHALLLTWCTTMPHLQEAKQDGNIFQPYLNIRAKTRIVLERVFKAQPLAFISSSVRVWTLCSEQVTDEAIFDCIDTLTPSAQMAIESICELASGKPGRSSAPDYRHCADFRFRFDPSYLAFLEAYMSRLEAPIALQVWSSVFSFARDVIASVVSTSSRTQLLPLLQCLTNLALTVAKTSALEDRRLRRDFQDTYAKILDVTVTNASKIAEAGIWNRAEVTKSEFLDRERSVNVDQGLEQIYEYLSTTIVPNLRILLVESDKVNSACSGIAVAVVGPAFRRQQVDASVLRVVIEISHISSATKIWRPAVYDFFYDSRLFRVKSLLEISYWKTLVHALFNSDKERFPDLLSRITSATSANINIFSNREQEISIKCDNLRRLGLVLLTGDRNHYLGQLPGIQERLVEMLKSTNMSARVHSEVYLCLRVLMCRISPQHLVNLWPVILSELFWIFEQTIDDPPVDGSEKLHLLLAACKFLDLLLVLQSEDFQIHQWMFVTDTTDVEHPPKEYESETIMDQMADLLSELSTKKEDSDLIPQQSLIIHSPTTPGNIQLRRPRLPAVMSLTSLCQLQSFFARASIETFESVYANNNIDWEAVENSLTSEIFDA